MKYSRTHTWVRKHILQWLELWSGCKFYYLWSKIRRNRIWFMLRALRKCCTICWSKPGSCLSSRCGKILSGSSTKMTSLSAIKTPSSTGPKLLTGWWVQTKTTKHSQSILPRFLYPAASFPVKTLKIRRGLKASKGYALSFILANKISTLRKSKGSWKKLLMSSKLLNPLTLLFLFSSSFPSEFWFWGSLNFPFPSFSLTFGPCFWLSSCKFFPRNSSKFI